MYVNHDIGKTKNDFALQAVLEGTTLRYTSNLHGIDWENMINNELSITSNDRKSNILHMSGQYSINPLILLSKVILDETDIYRYVMKSDNEFRLSLKSFANELSKYDQDFDSETATVEASSSLEYSLRKVYGQSENGLINGFLSVCNAITKKYNLTSKTAPLKHQQRIFRREEEKGIGLELPYSPTECWQLGATHNGALEGREASYTLSAIDMAPGLFQRWKKPFHYYGSNGDVYSSHSGTIRKHSSCSIEIFHGQSGYSTYYSHIYVPDFTNGSWIPQGTKIGRISLEDKESNCGCDYGQKNYECADGPHLHFELRLNGKPETLNNKTISNLRIQTGENPYDQFCSDADHCLTATNKYGDPCATIYRDIHNPENVICPVVMEANTGSKRYFDLKSKT